MKLPTLQIHRAAVLVAAAHLHHDMAQCWSGRARGEGARRVGNSPEVIHRVYEGCIYGQEEGHEQEDRSGT